MALSLPFRQAGACLWPSLLLGSAWVMLRVKIQAVVQILSEQTRLTPQL